MTSPRQASIDVGTNSVLLLVAERDEAGRLRAVEECADITRLGRGVDASRTLGEAGMTATLETVSRFVARARELGATGIVITATSAARDATNGRDFLDRLARATGVTPEVLSGDEEARLTYASAVADFQGAHALAAVDIGGGSTEVILHDAAGTRLFARSFDVGAVRMTERFFREDPPTAAERAACRAFLADAFRALPTLDRPGRLVGIAGTVTTLCAMLREVDPYEGARIHGQRLALGELQSLLARLEPLPSAQRARLPGLQAKRADVILAGGYILEAVLEALGTDEVTVSDRGLRWGVLEERFRKGA